ncbi:MBL fold metallo-hydrolase [Leisingera sp. ANG59]|uniref:MBL fold metallo-hydrolase n=1 Tax=Leisingera sp. ANG59 TaxID=2675221 RepID=UPI001574AB90|nr:MBL fold metallo-hydrolase [Leisingera sp. ANG59]NSY39364.1 MBL fold metallo-hydrolase [Leisingera sp. ANG59]
MTLTEALVRTTRVALTAATLALFSVAQPAQAQDDGALVVTLLGTGTPLNEPDRFSFSNLVQAGGLTLLIDAGRGTSIRLGQLGIPLGKVDGVFLTHFHSDHTIGLGDVFATGYIRVPTLGGRTEPLELYGPAGTARLAEGLRLAFKSDIDTRMLDEGVPEAATSINAHEFDEGVVFERSGVRVTMFKVLHGEKIDPSVGYRIEYNGHSVVFSSDTKYDTRVIEAGRGADVLVHEAGAAPQDVMDNPIIQNILDHHTSPEDVGRVFSDAQPGLAVYSHVVRLFGKDRRISMREIVDRTRTTYSGPLVVAEDLTQIIIDEKGTTLLRGGL